MSQAKHNHLISNVPNTEKNREFVKDINKKTKESNSIWRLSIRYRKPKEGHKYGYGGNLKCENANAFSVYVHDRRSYNQIPENQYRSKLWEENRKLEEENKRLKKDLALQNNPYKDWTESKLTGEYMDLTSKIVECFIDEDYSPCENNELRIQYNQVMEALKYAEKSD